MPLTGTQKEYYNKALIAAKREWVRAGGAWPKHTDLDKHERLERKLLIKRVGEEQQKRRDEISASGALSGALSGLMTLRGRAAPPPDDKCRGRKGARALAHARAPVPGAAASRSAASAQTCSAVGQSGLLQNTSKSDLISMLDGKLASTEEPGKAGGPAANAATSADAADVYTTTMDGTESDWGSRRYIQLLRTRSLREVVSIVDAAFQAKSPADGEPNEQTWARAGRHHNPAPLGDCMYACLAHAYIQALGEPYIETPVKDTKPISIKLCDHIARHLRGLTVEYHTQHNVEPFKAAYSEGAEAAAARAAEVEDTSKERKNERATPRSYSGVTGHTVLQHSVETATTVEYGYANVPFELKTVAKLSKTMRFELHVHYPAAGTTTTRRALRDPIVFHYGEDQRPFLVRISLGRKTPQHCTLHPFTFQREDREKQDAVQEEEAEAAATKAENRRARASRAKQEAVQEEKAVPARRKARKSETRRAKEMMALCDHVRISRTGETRQKRPAQTQQKEEDPTKRRTRGAR